MRILSHSSLLALGDSEKISKQNISNAIYKPPSFATLSIIHKIKAGLQEQNYDKISGIITSMRIQKHGGTSKLANRHPHTF